MNLRSLLSAVCFEIEWRKDGVGKEMGLSYNGVRLYGASLFFRVLNQTETLHFTKSLFPWRQEYEGKQG